ncbi:ATP-dependent DNA helicase [Microvirga brassicacearum]|uniref:ATP-binding protein n=1 Tax=Microvirga brassicacearum TaxID=2580413 RepID=A0A5N3PH22_9HYPH|nr:AAA family ATPase [Microvirga brassicacearum]KAB0269027.1 ATP-binding protein [Microvirga brassicacearum]
MPDWSPQQESALKDVRRWLADKGGRQFFYLAGFAGTGKTTLAKEMAEGVAGCVLYGAFTGKAALVLQRKGCVGASTIHSMIYTVQRGKGGIAEFVLNVDSPVNGAALVIIDEVSMVSEELARDLLSFGTRVLVLGDPAQLPPVRGTGYFTSGEPDVMLTEVHRQARDNPIIRLSMDVREGRSLDIGSYGNSKVIRRGQVDQAEVMKADQVLVGKNLTRRTYNGRMRELQNFKGTYPVVGERLVCLRNNKEKGLLNGGLWKVAKRVSATAKGINLIVEPDDAGMAVRATDVRIHPYLFEGRETELDWKEKRKFDEFDFGYALTVHKSQGSQWDNVYLFDESGSFGEHQSNHLYTGLTRAAEQITIVV